MKDEYDFSNAIRNPYAKNLKTKKVVTIRIDDDTVDYFKKLSTELGIPYQTLINSFLKDCAINHRKPNLSWQ